MSNYTITNKSLNKNKVFILQKSELEKRFDPQYYQVEYKKIVNKLKENKHSKLGEIVKFSKETWNQKDFFNDTFPYIEISEIDILSGEIQNISNIEISNAASRAKMIVRENDIIVSTTRPNRGAIALIKKEQDFSIASTGFCVIRNSEIDKNYLLAILKQNFILKQFEQRSSGGNYPAITQEELSSVIIPVANDDIQIKIKTIFQECFKQKKINEEKADKLLESIDTYLLNQLGIVLPQKQENNLKNRMFTSSISQLSGSRFDPNFNKIYYKEVSKSFKNSCVKFTNIKSTLEYIKTGTTPHQKLNPFTDEKEIIFLRNTNLKKYDIDLNKTKYVKKEFKNELIFSSKGEVIMCIAGTVGLSALNNIEKPISINQNVSALKFYDEIINPTFASYWFNTNVFIELTKRACSVATIYYLNNDNLKQLPIPLPPLKKQNEIVEHISIIRNTAKGLIEENKTLMKKANEEIENLILKS